MNTAHCLGMVYILTRFHKNPSICEGDMERTRKVYGETDLQMDGCTDR